jgi:hypothetical protein
MTLLLSLLERIPVVSLVRLACVLSLLSLALFCWAALVSRALPIILGMSLGHVAGVGGLFLFIGAVLAESMRDRLRKGSSNAE